MSRAASRPGEPEGLAEAWFPPSADRRSVLFVTHDLAEAIALADRVVVLSAGPATRPIAEFPITIPRPRDVTEIMHSPDYVELHKRIWETLKGEVLRARDFHP